MSGERERAEVRSRSPPSGVKKCILDGFQKKQKFSPLSRREGRKTFVFSLQRVRSADPMVDPQMAILGAILGQPWVKKTKVFLPSLLLRGENFCFF